MTTPEHKRLMDAVENNIATTSSGAPALVFLNREEMLAFRQAAKDHAALLPLLEGLLEARDDIGEDPRDNEEFIRIAISAITQIAAIIKGEKI